MKFLRLSKTHASNYSDKPPAVTKQKVLFTHQAILLIIHVPTESSKETKNVVKVLAIRPFH